MPKRELSRAYSIKSNNSLMTSIDAVQYAGEYINFTDK